MGEKVANNVTKIVLICGRDSSMSAGVLSAPSRSVSNSPGVGGGGGGRGGGGGGGSHRDLTAEEQGMVRRRHHGGGGGGQGGGNVRTRYRTFPEFPAVLCFFFQLDKCVCRSP